jgi:hypothetical protein
VHAPELQPGALVEVIVLVDSKPESTAANAASFIDAVAGVEIDAPADYSVNFEKTLYGRPFRHG